MDALSAVVAGGTLPNEGIAPKAGAGARPPVETTAGANGRGGLLAPKANGVLLEVVMVVLAEGKLKPDDDEVAPNKGIAADDDVVVVVVGVIDVDTRGTLLGNGNPLVKEAGNVNEALVVITDDALVFGVKPNKLGVADVVVGVVNNDPTERAGALLPKENCADLSEGTAVELVVAASGVPPNDPNVIVVGILIGDDDGAVVVGVVKSEGVVDALVTVVVVAVDELVDVAEPNSGKLEVVLGLI